MINKIFNVKGMHCASCSVIISKKLSKLDGVKKVDVNFANEKAYLELSKDVSVEKINDEIEKLGYSFFIEKEKMDGMNHSDDIKEFSFSDKQKELFEQKERIQFVLPITLLVFVLMMWDIFARTFSFVPNLPIPMELFNIIFMVLSTIVLFWIGKPFVMGVVRFIKYKVANMDTLIGIGTLVAYIYSLIITLLPQIKVLINLPEYTYFDVVIVVIGFVAFGKYLEARSKQKTGDAIEKLLNLQAKTALVIRDGKEVEVSIQEVLHGDLIIVKPGSSIPVDGVISDGASYVDEAMITGEPMPVSKKAGDGVVAGTMNTTGAFTFKATKVGSETMLAKIIKMVEEAHGSKAPIQALADKISSIFVPVVLGIAVLTLVVWLVVGTQYFGFSQALSYGLVSFVGILVIACPCALGLATPTAIIVGVGKGAREGILIKDAATLQKLHKVNAVVVDKTGTLTVGKPELISINLTQGKFLHEEDFISILATLENKSEHPLAHAIINYAKEKNIKTGEVQNFEIIKGKGLKGIINGTEYFAGNTKLITDLNLEFDIDVLEKETLEGKTPVILADKNTVLGVVMIADAVKPEAVEAVKNLHKLGIKVVMLTGDNKNVADYIAKFVGIDEVVAEAMPENKLDKVKELQAEGKIVAMAGDGVNDAPALAQADVGIAMATGTDVAIESAGITLLNGDISKLVKAIKLSKMTMLGIKQNLFWAFIYNIVGIPLAAGLFYPIFGWLLSPVFAGFAMAMSSVSVVGNSLRIKSKKL